MRKNTQVCLFWLSCCFASSLPPLDYPLSVLLALTFLALLCCLAFLSPHRLDFTTCSLNTLGMAMIRNCCYHHLCTALSVPSASQ